MRRIVTELGVLIYKPDHPRAVGEGYVPEEIIVMEDHIGRGLSADEDVKHLNGNACDNDIDNLIIVTPKYGHKPMSILDSTELVRKLSHTFTVCPYQRVCWKEVRSVIAKTNKIYLPWHCSYQTEGDVVKCNRYWNYLKEDHADDTVQANRSSGDDL